MQTSVKTNLINHKSSTNLRISTTYQTGQQLYMHHYTPKFNPNMFSTKGNSRINLQESIQNKYHNSMMIQTEKLA